MILYEIIGILVVIGLLFVGVKWLTDNVRIKKDDE